MLDLDLIAYRGIILIPVRDGRLVMFRSAHEKQRFVETHKKSTYKLYNNHAVEILYLVIDIEGTGWLLSRSAVPYYSAIDLIDRYL